MYAETRERGLGAEPKRRIMLGTYALSAGYYDAYYLRAQKVRTLIRRDFDEAFRSCDVIAGPVAPSVAFRLGEKTADPLQMYLAGSFTITANLAALPGLSVPCGLERESGMPVGLQLVGRPFDEETLLRAARALEREAGRSRARSGRDAGGRAMTRRIATLLWAALLVVPIAFLGVATTLESHAPSTEHGALLLWIAVIASAFNVAPRACCRRGSRRSGAAGERR